jgi:hypothetical protein
MFDLTKICFILYQASPSSILGKAILEIMASGKFSDLRVLILELRDILQDWPEILRTVFKPEEAAELKEQLFLI